VSEDCDPVRDRRRGSGFDLESITTRTTNIRKSKNYQKWSKKLGPYVLLGRGGGAGVRTACRLRSMAHTMERATVALAGSSGSRRAMRVLPLGREVMCKKTPSVFLSSGSRAVALLSSSGESGRRRDAASPEQGRERVPTLVL
jgi:hypothetical protein